MSSNHHPFTFDANWGFGDDSVFSDSNTAGSSGGPVPPPLEDDFLLLDGTNFLLLDGTNFLLL